LRRRGIDVLTADEAELRGAPDDEYALRSNQSGRVIVTQDADFLCVHGRVPHAGIAYCRQGTRLPAQMIAQLLLIAEVLEAEEMVGRVEYL
jgi:predicted nuclease of predicted toxin-antitoxin system